MCLDFTFNPVDKRRTVVLNLRPDQMHAAPQIQNNKWLPLTSGPLTLR